MIWICCVDSDQIFGHCWLEEVHLWAEAGGVEVHTESCCHLWVHVCTLGLQLFELAGGQSGWRRQ